jgi:hypothetical protein
MQNDSDTCHGAQNQPWRRLNFFILGVGDDDVIFSSAIINLPCPCFLFVSLLFPFLLTLLYKTHLFEMVEAV